MVDPMRPGHELAYHPGEMNLRCADIAVVSKVNSAFAHDVDKVVANIREVEPARGDRADRHHRDRVGPAQ